MEAPLAVSVVDAPAQIEDEETLIFTDGNALTTIARLPTEAQPFAFVPVTVYVVVTLGLTDMLADVEPVLQT